MIFVLLLLFNSHSSLSGGIILHVRKVRLRKARAFPSATLWFSRQKRSDEGSIRAELSSEDTSGTSECSFTHFLCPLQLLFPRFPFLVLNKVATGVFLLYQNIRSNALVAATSAPLPPRIFCGSLQSWQISLEPSAALRKQKLAFITCLPTVAPQATWQPRTGS